MCNRNNIKKIWSGIRSIINISKVKADYVPTLLESGKSIDNPCAIANILNNCFVNVGRNTDKDIPQGNCYPTSFLNGNFPELMFLSPVTSFEVESYLSQMDNNKSIGPCSIPVPLLKILKTHISPLLSSLINDSFLCGIFPNKLKLLLQFSRKALDKTKIIIGQYQCYLSLAKYMKKLCISASIVILNVIIFSTHFSLGLDRSVQLIMHS